MKNISLLFLLSVAFIACSKEESEPLINLSGEWTAMGYECAGRTYEEQINIQHDLDTGDFEATKITGDPCVTAGNVTFWGTYDGKGTNFSFVAIGGNPEEPNSARANGNMMMNDMNSMSGTALGTTVNFVRN